MDSHSLRRIAIGAWIATTLAIAVVVTVGKPGKLYSTFEAAGQHFRQGESLYPDDVPATQVLYRYSPAAAAAIAPLTWLPTHLGAVLWRCIQAIALLLALRAWARVASPAVSWPHLALLALPLSIGNLHNGQLNPLVVALMLIGIAAFSHDRYWLASLAIAGAALFKIYPLTLGLLLGIIEPRRFAPKLLLVAAAAITLPFAIQSPDYVIQQFDHWLNLVENDDRTHQPMHQGYHDFRKVLLRWGLPISLKAYRAIQIVVGCASAIVVLWGRYQGWDRARLVQVCASLGILWCTLFGPATESATYLLIAPIAAHALLAVRERTIVERVWICAAYGILVASTMIHWFPYSVSHVIRGTLIPQPHAALLLLGWTILQITRSPNRSI